MKKVIITDKNIVQNIIEIDAINETAFKNSLPAGYKLLTVTKGFTPIGGTYNKTSKKFDVPSISDKARAKIDLQKTDEQAADILEKILTEQALTSTDIDAWLLKRQNSKIKLGLKK